MKNTVIFILFVAVVVGLLFATSGEKYSKVPADDAHKGITEIASCGECHGQGRRNALKPSHPPKYECFKCHKPGATVAR